MWSVLLNDSEDIFTKKRYNWSFSPRKEITIDGMYPFRLDLIARDTLNNKRLWWVLAEANNVIFPFDEISYGQTLNLLAVSAPESFNNTLTQSELVIQEL